MRKLILNVNFTKDPTGIRKIELDDFVSQNSNIFNITPLSSCIDNTITRIQNTNIDLFLVRKRLINLMDTWNRFLCSGAFNEYGPNLRTYKIVGGNFRCPFSDYFFTNVTGNYIATYPLNFSTGFIYSKLLLLLNVLALNNESFNLNAPNNSKLNNAASFNLLNGSTYGPHTFGAYVNTGYDTNSEKFLSLIQEFMEIVKEIIDPVKFNNELGLNLSDLNILNPNWTSIFKNLYTNHRTFDKFLKICRLYHLSDFGGVIPQFGIPLKRNIEGAGATPWSIKNVLIDTNNYSGEPDNTDNTEGGITGITGIKRSKIACSMLSMPTPVVCSEQAYIDWSVTDQHPDRFNLENLDKPYVMIFNGGTIIHLPEEIRIKSNPQDPNFGDFDPFVPANQTCIAAKFWSIGTSNKLDPLYNEEDDIKLVLDLMSPNQPNSEDPENSGTYIPQLLSETTKIDFFDNLRLFLKLDSF